MRRNFSGLRFSAHTRTHCTLPTRALPPAGHTILCTARGFASALRPRRFRASLRISFISAFCRLLPLGWFYGSPRRSFAFDLRALRFPAAPPISPHACGWTFHAPFHFAAFDASSLVLVYILRGFFIASRGSTLSWFTLAPPSLFAAFYHLGARCR